MTISNIEVGRRRKELVIELGFLRKDISTWIKKYKTFRKNKKREGYLCTITFKKYLSLAIKAGVKHPSQIGLRMDQFQMGRRGDTGDYVPGNCRFITGQQNLNEKFLNGGAARGYKKSSKTLSGRTKENSAYKRSSAKKLSKPFRLVSPSGKIYKGSNLVEFCEKHELSVAMMMRLCRGECKQAQSGWTGTYTGDRGDHV